MKRVGKWLFLALLGAALLVASALFSVQHWIGSDDFKARAQAQVGAALGVAVALGRIEVDPWPVPAVALTDVQVQTPSVLSAGRVEVRLVLGALLAGRLELATLILRQADLPQAGVEQLLAARKKKTAPSAVPDAPPTPPVQGGAVNLVPHRVVLDAVTWRSASGQAITLDADAHLGPDNLPDSLSLRVLAGALQGAKVKATRKALAWRVEAEHAGGTIRGELALQTVLQDGKEISLQGQFETQGLELGALARPPPGALSGYLDASTSLQARALQAAGLLEGLRTQSKFSVRDAVVHGVDLARAVTSIGLHRGGQTRLDTLTGQVATHGKAVQLSNLVATSGVLSASGNVALAASRALSGRVYVNLGASALGSMVGVPLVVGGTLDAPEVTLTRAAMLGAAIGTALLPGLGTGAGASLGDKLADKFKGLFGK